MKYILPSLAIAVISFVALSFSQTTTAVQAMIALPGAAGLVFALWEIIKSNIEHQHRLLEKGAEQAFVISATSHMAQRAFEKHVEFSEQYVSKANEGLGVLFREGPTKEALSIAGELYGIRQKFILWETAEVTSFLDVFEAGLRGIGADEHYLASLPVGDKRTELVQSIFERFKNIVSLSPLPASRNPEIAVSHIIGRLRDHLGVTQLTELRAHYVARAWCQIGRQGSTSSVHEKMEAAREA